MSTPAAAKLLSFPGLMVVVLMVSERGLAAGRNEALYARAEHYQTEAINLLERLVNIDSGTGYEKGLDNVVEILSAELGRLGPNVELKSAAPIAGKNVVATFTGTGKGKVLLIAHMDTVFKAGTASERPFQLKGGRAY